MHPGISHVVCAPFNYIRYTVWSLDFVVNLRDFWRHFGLCRDAVHSDWCFFAPWINILTYLLTYLYWVWLNFPEAPIWIKWKVVGDIIGIFVCHPPKISDSKRTEKFHASLWKWWLYNPPGLPAGGHYVLFLFFFHYLLISPMLLYYFSRSTF